MKIWKPTHCILKAIPFSTNQKKLFVSSIVLAVLFVVFCICAGKHLSGLLLRIPPLLYAKWYLEKSCRNHFLWWPVFPLASPLPSRFNWIGENMPQSNKRQCTPEWPDTFLHPKCAQAHIFYRSRTDLWINYDEQVFFLIEKLSFIATDW